MALALIVTCLVGMSLAYTLGVRRSLALAGNVTGLRMHSLPQHHGILVALWCGLPALVVVLLWAALEGPLVAALVRSELPLEWRVLPDGQRSLIMNEIANVASGNGMAEAAPAIRRAAERLNQWRHTSSLGMAGVVLSLGLAGGVLAQRRLRPELRARTHVEALFKVALALGSTIAILTTLGIVLSVLFEALRFFRAVPLTWRASPRSSTASSRRSPSLRSFGAWARRSA